MPISRQETGLSLSRATQSHTDTDAAAAAGQLVSYKGTCHCGRNRFEADLPEIKVAIACNCGLCHKSGYLWAFPEAGHIEYTKGTAETLGTFDTESLSHEVGLFFSSLVLFFLLPLWSNTEWSRRVAGIINVQGCELISRFHSSAHSVVPACMELTGLGLCKANQA